MNKFWPLIFLSLSLTAADLTQAKVLMDAKKEAEAKPLLEKATMLEPKNVDALFMLGVCQRQLNEKDAALETLEKAAELAPERIDVVVEYATLAGELSGKRRSLSLANKAKNLLEKVLEKEPKNFKAREWLIGFYSGAPWIAGGSMKKAIAHAKVIGQQDAGRGFYWMTTLNIKDKRYEDAFALCEDTLKRNPSHQFARFQYGICAIESGLRLDKGREMLEACLQIDAGPTGIKKDKIYIQLGLLAEKQGDAAKARSYYEQGLAANPNSSRLKKLLGK